MSTEDRGPGTAVDPEHTSWMRPTRRVRTTEQLRALRARLLAGDECAAQEYHRFDLVALHEAGPMGARTIGMYRSLAPFDPAWVVEAALASGGPEPRHPQLLTLRSRAQVRAVRDLLDVIEGEMRAAGVWEAPSAEPRAPSGCEPDKWTRCMQCGGCGNLPVHTHRKCRRCQGSGVIEAGAVDQPAAPEVAVGGDSAAPGRRVTHPEEVEGMVRCARGLTDRWHEAALEAMHG